MADDIRYAGYPSAKVFDELGNQVRHLLWGDWVKVTGPAVDGVVPVFVRSRSGFMAERDLQAERLLELVFVDVGQGDGCLVVTPNDKVLVIDAGVADNMYRFLRWRFNFRANVTPEGVPRRIHAAIITHPDSDHYRGFGPLFREPDVRFERVYHNGIMEQEGKPFGPEPTEGGVKYVADLIETKADLEAFLADEARYKKKLYPNLMRGALKSLTADGDIRMLHASGDPDAPNYLEGFGPQAGVSVRILGPIPDVDAAGQKRLRWFRDRPSGGSWDAGKTKNGHSVILLLEYRDLRLFLGGDLNSPAEAFLLERYTGMTWPPQDSNREKVMIDAARRHFGADITKCCHHGSADFTDTFMRAVFSAATVVSSGDSESHAHPRSDTLGAIGLHGRGWRPLIFSTELSRSTRESEGAKGEDLWKLVQKLAAEPDAAARTALLGEAKPLVDQLSKRNVEVYGAINLRTDGRKAVFAYMLEVPRTNTVRGKKTVTRWDLYTLERPANGPLVFAPDGASH